MQLYLLMNVRLCNKLIKFYAVDVNVSKKGDFNTQIKGKQNLQRKRNLLSDALITQENTVRNSQFYPSDCCLQLGIKCFVLLNINTKLH
jgi:hypothetical protein